MTTTTPEPELPAGPGAGGAPRRPMAAGHVLVVAVVALVVGSFLNAQGLRKMAVAQEDGWRRDVGMAFTAPLADIAGFLRLDMPRTELKSALGREDDDRIVTEIELPPAQVAAGAPEPVVGAAIGSEDETTNETGADTAGTDGTTDGGAGATTAAEPASRRSFSDELPMRLWIAGDSLVIAPGEALLQLAAETGAVRAVADVEGELATGLERPDRYDWFGRIPEEMKDADPDAVVLSFGANDIGGYMSGLPDGVDPTAFGTDEWKSEYRRRVGGIMDMITAEEGRKRLLVWIGAPIIDNPDHNDDYRVVNTIYKQEADKRAGRVVYIDTYFAYRAKGGGFARNLPDEDGKLIEVRSPDGIHFTPAGGAMTAERIMAAIEQTYDLRSWREDTLVPD